MRKKAVINEKGWKVKKVGEVILTMKDIDKSFPGVHASEKSQPGSPQGTRYMP